MTKSSIRSLSSYPAISTETLAHWQRLVETISTTLTVSAVLIAKADLSQIEILASSNSADNPFQLGDRFTGRKAGFFAQTIASRSPLIVANAVDNFQGENGFDDIRSMSAYLGLSLAWPDGEIFGFVCVLDHEENRLLEEHQAFFMELRTGLERDLKIETLTQTEVEPTIHDSDFGGESKQAPGAVEKSEKKYRELVDEAATIILRWDIKGNITFFNEYAQTFFGFSEEEIIGKNVVGTIVPETEFTGRDLASLMEQICLDPGKFEYNENENIKRNGEHVWIAWKNKPIFKKSGELFEIYSVGIDITARKRVEEALRLSEQRLRLSISQAEIVLWSVDKQLKFTQSLGAGLRRLGLKENQLVDDGFDLYQLFQTDSMDYPSIRFHLLALKGSAVSYEAEWQGRYFQSHVTPQKDSDGNIVGCIGVAVDITERKHAEHALRRSEVLELLAKGGTLSEILTALVISTEKRGSNVFCAICLLDKDGKHLSYEVAPNLPDFFIEALDKMEIGLASGSCGTVVQTGERIIVEDISNHPEWRNLQELAEKAGLRACCCEPIKSSKGVVLGTFPVYYKNPCMPNKSDLEFIQDSARIAGIAIESKQAEEALRESEQRYRSLVELSPDGVAVHDLEGKLLFVNTAARNLVGAPGDMDVVGESIGRFIHPGYFAESVNLIEKVVKEQKPSETAQQKFVTTTGQEIDVEVSGGPLLYEGQPAIQIIARDITARKRAEEKILASEKELAAILDSIQDIYYRTDVAGHIFRLSPSVFHVLGYKPEELLGEKIASYWVNPHEREKFIDALNSQGGVVENYEAMAKRKDGAHIWVSANSHYVLDDQGNITGVEGTIRDVSKRKQAEERARQHQTELAYITRLSTMGELATGIAHELNQPLTAIANYAAASSKMVAADTSHSEKVISALQAIQVQADRASEIIRRLRKFVKKQNPQKTDVNINALIADVMDFMEMEINEHKVQVRLDLLGNLPQVHADAIQIEQVLVNLIRNSLDAMSHVDAVTRQLNVRSYLNETAYVQVDVADTGEGIDAGSLNEIFAPHVTTKSTKGMGMGLAISRSIIDLHNGRLWAQSQPGKGATFFFALPAKVKES